MAKKKDAVEIEQRYKDGYVKLKLHNVEVFWAKVHEPDTKFEHKWCVDLHLDDDIAEEMKRQGFNVKDITNRKTGAVTENVLKVAKKVHSAKGSKNKPPVVVGPDGRTPFTEDIGNGSICNLNITAKAWPIHGEWVLSCYLDGIQVVKHEEYAGGFDNVEEDSDVPF